MSAPFPAWSTSLRRPGPAGPRGPEGPRRPGRRRPGALAPTLRRPRRRSSSCSCCSPSCGPRCCGSGSSASSRCCARGWSPRPCCSSTAAVIMGVAVWASLTSAFRSPAGLRALAPRGRRRWTATASSWSRCVASSASPSRSCWACSRALPPPASGRRSSCGCNRQPFGDQDPQFGLDVGFYVFTLPLLQFVTGFATAVVLLAGLAALLTHYLYGGLRLGGQGARTTPEARVHLGVLGAAFLLLRAVSYWLERYALHDGGQRPDHRSAVHRRERGHPRPHAARGGVRAGRAHVPVHRRSGATGACRPSGVGLLVLVAVAAGGIWPQVIQRFQVEPNELTLETPYIRAQHRRHADRLRHRQHRGHRLRRRAERRAGPARRGRAHHPRHPVAGPEPRLADVPPAAADPAVLRLPRLPGRVPLRDGRRDPGHRAVGARAQPGRSARRPAQLGQRPHRLHPRVRRRGGRAATSAPRAASRCSSSPASSLPSGEGEAGRDRTRHLRAAHLLRRVQPGVQHRRRARGGRAAGAATTPTPPCRPGSATRRTRATAASPMGDFFTQLLFAIKFRAEEIVLSDTVNSESRIMFDREPRERVEKVAPWLELDGDPYPPWSTTRWSGSSTGTPRPASTRTPSPPASTRPRRRRSPGPADNIATLLPQRVNYVRNSVKATVDAYDGEVTLYAWDEEEPILQAWRGSSPNSVRRLSEISGELMSQVRYPQDLFKVQREVLERVPRHRPGLVLQRPPTSGRSRRTRRRRTSRPSCSRRTTCRCGCLARTRRRSA